MDFLNELKAYRDREVEVLNKLNLEDVNTVMNVLEDARLSGKHIFICGNGGSAATASHYVCDFNKGVNMGLLKLDGHTSYRTPTAEKMKVTQLYNFE